MKYKLNVPYVEKDEAKGYGAKWDFREKYWYCEVVTPELRRWYVPEYTELEHTQVIAPEPVRVLASNSIEDAYKTVSEVSEMILVSFNSFDRFQNILVKGEVTNYDGPNRGHYYFSIKDERCLLPCFMWSSDARLGMNFKLEKGQQVAICGDLEYYKATGKSQLHVKRVMNIGDGEANLAFLKLKQQLKEEGLFDPEHKKPIPKHPKKVGIVTSKDGQAIRDICKVSGRRNPYVQLILYHVNVQGRNAVSTVVEGIKVLDTMGLDTIIIGRGGGSDEELKAYNEEAIARAVFEAQTPIISAVGHEGHVTLIDYTADERAATPSEAAEKAIPDIMTDIRRLQYIKREMAVNVENRLEQRRLLLEAKMATLEKYSPEQRLKERKDQLALVKNQLKQTMQNVFEGKKHRYEVLLARLNGLSPTAKLINGFGYISHREKPLHSIEEVQPGEHLQITIHDGELDAQIMSMKKKTIG